MNTSLFLTRSHLSPNLDIIIFVSFAVSVHHLDSKTASTIATSIVHSKLDCCNYNSLYHNLPKSQISRLQQIQNSLAHAVVKAPKSSHITPILQSLHWLKITELFFRTDSMDSSDCLPTLLSISIFLLFLFFSFILPSVL